MRLRRRWCVVSTSDCRDLEKWASSSAKSDASRRSTSYPDKPVLFEIPRTLQAATCLSLMEIQQKLSSNRLQGLAEYAVTRLALLQSWNPGSPNDTAHNMSARRIDLVIPQIPYARSTKTSSCLRCMYELGTSKVSYHLV